MRIRFMDKFKLSRLIKIVVAGFLLLPVTRLWAGDLEWSGLYRVEGQLFNKPSLDSSTGTRKEYGVHTLILRPKIVAADGLYISGQINVFNEGSADGANQLGDYFGGGLDGSPYANNLSSSQKQNKIRLSQYYLTYAQEYASLIVGRAPLHFGLGMTHNAGRGEYDHFSDTRDMIGYKMILGNFFFFPMYAKIDEGDISGYDDINELTLQLQYENPESDAAMGVIYQNRKSGLGGTTTANVPGQTGTDLAQLIGGGMGAVQNGDLNTKTFNVFYKKSALNYNVGFEVAQQSGDLGIRHANGDNMSYGGFGAVLDYEYHPIGKKNSYGFKLGYATGDDPSTTNEFEGFMFDRNYDIAMFLFNHGLGQVDLLHTSSLTHQKANSTYSKVYDQPDVETISNVTFLSTYFKRKWNDKWSMIGVLTTGLLDDDTVGNGPTTTDADLGYELNFSLIYSVSDKISWVNQFGYFEPGKAWEVNNTNDSDSMYGFVSKAAVSF